MASDKIQGDFIICSTSRASKGTETLVLKSFSVWINKPHVANRRLCGAKLLQVYRFGTIREVTETLDKIKEEACCSSESFERSDKFSDFKDLSEEKGEFLLLLRELIPKSEHFRNILEAVLYDKAEKSVKFIPLLRKRTESELSKRPTEELEYKLQFRETDQSLPEWSQVNEIVLSWSSDDKESNDGEVRRQVTSDWLKTVLLDKLVNWSQVNDLSTSVTSLQLVSVDKYKDTYVRLKNMYGRDLVKNWTERTDPQKFVYEDVAIAAYLLLIWEEDRKNKNLQNKQSFVDLGCGNGLLVYILTREGHKGLGIDLRKRKIWDTFGPAFDLKEETVTPSGDNLFPDYDWIIGNHSDELTPWIPVIAARSSYQCNFFVLPCCHHDFVGKFCHQVKGKSQYAAYLEYVKEIVFHCGFFPESDTLRIPSTKRICFIGRTRSYEEKMESSVDRDRQNYIDKQISCHEAMMKQNGKQNSATSDRSNSIASHFSHTENAEDFQISQTERSMGDSDCLNGNVHESVKLDQNMSENIHQNLLTDSLEPSSFSIPSESGRDKRKYQEQECKTVDSEGTEIKRSHPEKKLKAEIQNNFALKETISTNSSKSEANWAETFKPRVETGMRNCQRVPEEVKKEIVDTVFLKVLKSDSSAKCDLGSGRFWRKGGAVPLGDVVSSIDQSTLKELKAECGGLQTLLRNHSHVFQVTGGVVRLRDFTEADPWKGRKPKKGGGKDMGDRHKTTPCWFFAHHPDGCPRDTDQCTFAHGMAELRPQPVKKPS